MDLQTTNGRGRTMKDYQKYLNKLYKIYDELFVWTGLPDEKTINTAEGSKNEKSIKRR
jgi:hypothetical protein